MNMSCKNQTKKVSRFPLPATPTYPPKKYEPSAVKVEKYVCRNSCLH